MGRSGPVFRFGVFEVDVEKRQFSRNGVELKIQDQFFQLLVYFVSNPAEVMTRERLQRELWPEGTYVSFENSLYIAIKKLRQLLGDEPNAPRYIETIPKRGYRFVAAVNVAGAVETAETIEPQSLEEPTRGEAAVGRSNFLTRRPRHLYAIAIAMLFLVIVSVIALMTHKSQARSLAS